MTSFFVHQKSGDLTCGDISALRLNSDGCDIMIIVCTPLEEVQVQAIHDDVSRGGMFIPVSRDEAKERAWLDCDLASLAENQLGDLTHPRDVRCPECRQYTSCLCTLGPHRVNPMPGLR